MKRIALAICAATLGVLGVACQAHTVEQHCEIPAHTGTLVDSDRTSLGDYCKYTDGTEAIVDYDNHEVRYL